jgi:TonB family protein
MNDSEAWKAWEGLVVDARFPLKQWLGGSDHSAVFLTERPGQGKVAIKLIKTDTVIADQKLARLRAAAQLSHPHLIRIFETGRADIKGTPVIYAVMELADEDLSQILPQRALSPAEVAEMLPPLLDALSYLHGKGLIHGSVKPSNVVAVGEQLKLSSEQAVPAAQPPSERRIWGMYDAPERAGGKVSPVSDVWSVGVMIVSALTQNVSATAQSAPGVAASIPEPFGGITRECLQIDPNARCSIADIQARLRPEARSVPYKPEPPQPVTRRPGREADLGPDLGLSSGSSSGSLLGSALGSNRGMLIGIAAVLVILIAAVFFFVHGRNSSDQTAQTSQQSQSQTTQEPAPQAAPPPAAATPPSQPAAVPKPASSRGEVRHQVLPDVPQSAKNTITGTIKISVRVDVDSSGKVSAAKLTSPGPSKYFANLALNAARSWEFSPPRVDGQPAPSAWLLKFRFRRSSTQVSPERTKH